MEAKFTIDGKEVSLTEGDLKKIGVTEEKIKEFADLAEKAKNAKVFVPTPGANYYTISSLGEVAANLDCTKDSASKLATTYASVGNYCKNEEMMKARAALETLHRLVWRESIIAGGNKVEWDGETKHWFVSLDYSKKNKSEWDVFCDTFVRDVFTPYFPDEESARRVIDTVIEPFIAENPYFLDVLRGKC